MIILFTVLTVGGGCHTLVEKLNLRAPSQWTDLDQSGGGSGGGIEAGEGGVRGGSLSRGAEHVDDDGPAEALMPEFRVETFEDGMAKLVRFGCFFFFLTSPPFTKLCTVTATAGEKVKSNASIYVCMLYLLNISSV